MQRIRTWLIHKVADISRFMVAATCGFLFFTSVNVIVRGYVGPILTDDAASINLDLLQSLAFLVAWTSLLITGTVWLTNRIWEVWTDLGLAQRNLDSIRLNIEHESVNSSQGNTAGANHKFHDMVLDGARRMLRAVMFLGTHGLGWSFLLLAVTSAYYRLRWAISYAKVDPSDDEISLLTIKVGRSTNWCNCLVFLSDYSYGARRFFGMATPGPDKTIAARN